MVLKITRAEAQEMADMIQTVLYPVADEEGRRIMCVTIPSNGLYVAGKVARYVLEQNVLCVDMETYFRGMKLGDYYDLKATFSMANEDKQKGR